MNRVNILTSARLAGQVKRYHTHPTLTQQTVAEHTWQGLRIWYQLWGPPPPAITTYLIWHDAGELVTGDPPYPVKQNNPDLKSILDRMERTALEDMGGFLPDLNPIDRMRVKLVDLIEMNEFGIHELRLGNQYAHPIVDDTRAKIRELAEQLGRVSQQDRSLINKYFENTQECGLWLKSSFAAM